jgi:ATP-dependent DNA helicase RecG
MPRTDEARAALAAIQAGARPRDLESATLEFKEQGRSEGDALRTLADAALCFANASGGVVVLGVADQKTGAAALPGCTVEVDAARRRVWELSRPPLTVDAWEERVGEVRLVFVSVPQSPEIHSDPQGRAPRRIGRDCQPMDPSEQMRLREDRRGIDLTASDSKFLPNDLSEPALEGARELLAKFPDERRRLARLGNEELLRALGVLNLHGRVLVAGQLLFGKSGQRSPPTIVYEYRATPGGEPKAIERLPGPLLTSFQAALQLFRARQSATPLHLPGGQQVQLEDIPTLAVREAIANALIHRDHHLTGPVNVIHSPSLLAVVSPGPLVSGVTPDNILTHPSKPRNPCLARAARVLGLAEEVGRGVDRMFREMISSGLDLPRIESHHDHVRVSLGGGRAKAPVARYAAQLPEQERDDTDTMLVLHRLCNVKTISAQQVAPLLQKAVTEVELVLRRLATDAVAILEPTRQTMRRTHPSYRLRGDVLRELGAAVPYQRRTVDEMDRKVVDHVREYGKVTNRTVQNMLDVEVQRARGILRDMVDRHLLRKTSTAQRGPSVEYGPGSQFPGKGRGRT